MASSPSSSPTRACSRAMRCLSASPSALQHKTSHHITPYSQPRKSSKGERARGMRAPQFLTTLVSEALPTCSSTRMAAAHPTVHLPAGPPALQCRPLRAPAAAAAPPAPAPAGTGPAPGQQVWSAGTAGRSFQQPCTITEQHTAGTMQPWACIVAAVPALRTCSAARSCSSSACRSRSSPSAASPPRRVARLAASSWRSYACTAQHSMAVEACSKSSSVGTQRAVLLGWAGAQQPMLWADLPGPSALGMPQTVQ